jgi:hypothetical protein
MKDANLSQCHCFANEADVDLDMLCAMVVDVVSSHIDGTNIVTVDHSGQGKGTQM